MKGFQTRPEQNRTYTRSKAEESIQKEITAGVYVALDISKLSQADRDDLEELVVSHPEWAGKVVIY